MARNELGRIVEVDYVWEDDPDCVIRSYVAIGIAVMPEFFDDHIVFYFHDEETFKKARDGFYDEFHIVKVYC